MCTITRKRAAAFTLLLITAALVTTATQPSLSSSSKLTLNEARANNAQPRSVQNNSTFYILRPDLRKCASPLCGGYFVRRVNFNLTRCANGRYMSECYVASLDWNGATEVEINRVLLRGSIVTNRSGRYGVLKVTEAWRAANDKKPYGDFFRVRDLGLRCIAAPCPTHQEAKVNTTSVRNMAGVDINSVGADDRTVEEAQTALTSRNGIIVAGAHSAVTGPAGRSEMLKGSQFYLRNESSAAMKPCMKTGCSGQICSDHEVISTCEYRTEYECYKKAVCERQANGDCGFTKTRELTSCLARKG
jgi:hypothetical protein